MDKLRVGVLGLRRGLSHLRNFLNTEGAEVIGAADRIEQWRDRAAEAATGTGGQVRFVAEFDELLEMKPDAVAIASNGRQQAEHAIQAMEAGCHVLSEVPGAFTQEEIVHIAMTSERTGRQYMPMVKTSSWCSGPAGSPAAANTRTHAKAIRSPERKHSLRIGWRRRK